MNFRYLDKDKFSEGGSSPIYDQYVCAECFEDYAIRDFMNDNVEVQQCSYCENKSDDKPIAASLNDVVEFPLVLV